MLSIPSSLSTISTIIITAFVIKLIDDYMDGDSILFKGIINNMSTGITPYCVILFSIACMFNHKITITLFIGAYVLGMIHDYGRRLTFLLRGYHEAIILIALGGILIGIYDIMTGLAIMVIIQLLDDLIDYKRDLLQGKSNLVNQLGIGEVILLTSIIILFGIKFFLVKMTYVLIVFFTFEVIELRVHKAQEKRESHDFN